MSRLVWKKESNDVNNEKTTSSSYNLSGDSDAPKIKLTPMQIKTFIVNVKFNESKKKFLQNEIFKGNQNKNIL